MASRPVFQYELGGNYVTRHESISDAARVMGCNESSIRKVVDKDKASCGFRWKSKKNVLKPGTEYYTKDGCFKAGEVIWKEFKKVGKLEKYDEKCNVVNNTLIIGDLHAPFTRPGYLDFCKEIRDKYFCNNIVFIGDLIDNHFSSFHETDPDGHSAAEELRLAKLQIEEWYKAFPKAKVCIGNHDAIPARKSFNGGISKVWLKSISEVLNTPNWEFSEEFVIDGVLYIHGVGRKALNRMNADIISVVQGHYHSEGYISYTVGRSKKLFSMQVGCGVDDRSYAMAYGKYFDKMHISCGVVLENGNLPILEYMNL